MSTKFKRQILAIIEHSPNTFDENLERLESKASKKTISSKFKFHFEQILIFIIILSIVLVILETECDLYNAYNKTFFVLEAIFSAIFTLEYILRIYTADIHEEYNPSGQYSKFKSRRRYALSLLGMIDLISFLPFYFLVIHAYFIPIEFMTLRIVRLLRLFRIFEIAHYSEKLKMMIKLFRIKKGELVLSILSVLILIVISSALMYAFEHPKQPEKFSSIISSMWWSVATVTTIGYGDVFPVTVPGQVFTGIISILGILLIAIPTGIMSAGFIELAEKDKKLKILETIESEKIPIMMQELDEIKSILIKNQNMYN